MDATEDQITELADARGMTLGATAFDAYNQDRGGVNYLGDKTPPWEDLPEEIRHAWEVAARQVLSDELTIEMVYGSPRRGLLFVQQQVKERSDPSCRREIALVLTKLDEAQMWFARALARKEMASWEKEDEMVAEAKERLAGQRSCAGHDLEADRRLVAEADDREEIAAHAADCPHEYSCPVCAKLKAEARIAEAEAEIASLPDLELPGPNPKNRE